MAQATPTFDPKLLDVLRCPVAVHYTDKGADPGRLELVRDGYWLVSADSGYKYPIINGIPKVLVEEGARWKDTPTDALPVPPPNDAPAAEASAPIIRSEDGAGGFPAWAIAGVLLVVGVVVGLLVSRNRDRD